LNFFIRNLSKQNKNQVVKPRKSLQWSGNSSILISFF
jgi:hypothetical protein